MKTMKQAIVFLAALAAIAAVAVLAAGCAMPGLEKPAAPEAGMLRVSLGTASSAGTARTLLPQTYEVTSLYYTLTFTGGGPGPVNESIALGQSSGDFFLAEGTWDLAVKGFASQAGAADPANALVSGGESGIVISASAGALINVALTPDESKITLTQLRTGTLAWELSFPAGVTQASLTIYNEDGVTPVTLDGGKPNPVILIGADTGSLILSSGVYELELRLYMAGKAALKGLTAHVYDGLVTRAEYAFTDADFAGYTTEAITAFTLDDGSNPPYPGRINHAARTITVFVPPGTAVTGLTAAVTHAGLALVSDPATPDFTNPVTYTVTLEDGEDITYTVTVVSADTVTTAAELTALLSGASSGESSADPILVKITVDLTDGTDGWAALLAAIETGDKYVSLDLSDCTMAGMTGTPGEFYPGTADTGERYVTGLVLPDAAESIKERSYFANFISLTSLEASGVQTVGEYAFYGCTGLETVSLPAATSIGDYAFYGCTSLGTVSLPAAITIGNNAFYGCTGLTTASLPAATTIPNYAFDGCTSLVSVSLPAATSIGNYAFAGCTGLGTASLPEAAGIGDCAFVGCTSLRTVSLPAAAAIGASAFWGCTSLVSVSLPAAITIGTGAFSGCTSLGTVSLPTAITIGGGAFSDCRSLGTVSLPAATTIGTDAFSGCTGLVSVSLPAATGIPDNAFYGCTSLRTVFLPVAASIGEQAFSGTGGTALTITLGATAPKVGTNMFKYVSAAKTVTVLVPNTGSAVYGPIPAAYSGSDTANNWGNAFRGKGWDNTNGYGSGPVNSYITLNIDYITP